MTQETSFKSATGETVALKSVHLSGNLEGLLLSMKVQQRYRNDTGKNLETVYTFPLAWGATLLGLKNLGVDLPFGYPEEAYPGYAAPLVVKSHQSGRVACGLARFGLIPSWYRDDKRCHFSPYRVQFVFGI